MKKRLAGFSFEFVAAIALAGPPADERTRRKLAGHAASAMVAFKRRTGSVGPDLAPHRPVSHFGGQNLGW